MKNSFNLKRFYFRPACLVVPPVETEGEVFRGEDPGPGGSGRVAEISGSRDEVPRQKES